MTILRKPPLPERHHSGFSPSMRPLEHCQGYAHAGHVRQLSPLAAGFQDFYAGRFRLATWLLERHSRLGSQRATSALLLVLIDLLLVAFALSLFILGVKSFDPAWWLLHLLLLGVTMLTLGCTTLSALLALLAAARLRPVVAAAAAGTETGVFFQSGAGALAGSNSWQSVEQFRQKFLQSTQQQMLDGVLAEVYREERLRSRQERWLWRAVFLSVVAYLLFGLTAIGACLGFIAGI